MNIYDVCIGFAFIFEAMLIWQYLKELFYTKYKSIAIITVIAFGYSLAYLAFLNFDFIINAIVFIAVNFIICITCFSAGLKETVFHVTIISAIMFGSEVFALYLSQQIFGTDLMYYEEPLVGATLVLISKLLYFVILQILILFFTKKNIKDTNNSNFKVIWYLWVTPLAIFIMYFIFFQIILTSKLSIELHFLIAGICIAFLFANILVFLSYQYNQQLNKRIIDTQAKLLKESSDKEFYQMLNDQHENQNILIHDIKKHLNTLKTYAAESSTEKIRDYLDQVEDSDIFKSTIRFCDNDTLNLILYRYKSLFKRSNISASFILPPNSLNFMEDCDITSLFGNLLDNSYDATKNLDIKFVDFSVLYNPNNSETSIKIINSCNSTSIKKRNGIFMTTKNCTPPHGYGLKSIHKVIEKYHGTGEFYIDDSDSTFHCFIILPDIQKDII